MHTHIGIHMMSFDVDPCGAAEWKDSERRGRRVAETTMKRVESELRKGQNKHRQMAIKLCTKRDPIRW